MTIAVGHRNVAAVAAAGAVFLLGCFSVGVFAVRTSDGVDADRRAGVSGHLSDQTAADGVDRAVFGVRVAAGRTAQRQGYRAGRRYTTTRSRSFWPSCSSFRLPAFGFRRTCCRAIFLLTVAFFAAAGVAGGNDPELVGREALFLCEMVAGFVLALLIVRTNYVRESHARDGGGVVVLRRHDARELADGAAAGGRGREPAGARREAHRRSGC